MVKVKSRPQTERVTKVIVVRKSVIRKGVGVQIPSVVLWNFCTSTLFIVIVGDAKCQERKNSTISYTGQPVK
jgi:hypothetical protein